MSRLSTFVPPSDRRKVRRRPNLPGARRRPTGGGLGDQRRIPPGLEPFVGAAGLEPLGGADRGTPQQRADLQRRTDLQAFRGAGNQPPGIDLAPGGFFTPGPGGSFGTTSAPSTAGLGEAPPSEVPNFATPGPIQAARAGRGVQFPTRTSGGFQPTPGGNRRPGFSGILPPPPFQSFDDFFAVRRLQNKLQTQIDNPFPLGGGFRFTPEQARIRAAGGDPGESTFIGQPGQVPGGAGGGAGGGAPGPQPGGGPIQQAGPPSGAFGSGGPSSEPIGGGTAGINIGLLENQAIFAALRDQFMRALIPQLGGRL